MLRDQLTGREKKGGKEEKVKGGWSLGEREEDSSPRKKKEKGNQLD